MSPGTLKSILLQPRDLAFMRGLFESRIMTVSQAAALHFDGKPEAAKKRIQKLKAEGLIAARPRTRAYDPSILFLTREGYKVLDEQGALDGYPRLGMKSFDRRTALSSQTLHHELQVMSVKAAMVAAINKTDRFTIAEFSTWPLLNEFNVSKSAIDRNLYGEITVKPDGFIRIYEEDKDERFEHLFFLEVDRSKESQTILAHKALCYLEYYRSGKLAERLGGTRDNFPEYPFRVLFVLPNAERRNNTVLRLLRNNPPSLTQVWLTTSPEACTDPLGSIWIRPKDYREAVQGTPFDVQAIRSDAIYRRRTEREDHIERMTEKRWLFAS